MHYYSITICIRWWLAAYMHDFTINLNPSFHCDFMMIAVIKLISHSGFNVSI